MENLRIGFGYDIHPLIEGRPLFIGGIQIPYIKGLSGHSDGDVLLHAICDALLGATGKQDIGECFPDTDPSYEGISSRTLLEKLINSIKQEGFNLINIDCVIIASQPNFVPFKKAMQQIISQTTGVKQEAVSIKAKTNNGIGEVGRAEAIAAYAVCLLKKE
ncbi:MAG: 2-C-methyl-D-erythritol 2,4-cyclodiphosphate synthase [Candidatus Omnitrophica bacterium]|nr:2-C-methyl-D-erythritol 2,4-cyclodiphosphate synthase [Candidatus Omnitrophota bacterium]